MNLVSLVWFLLFCPFLFVFLLRLGNSHGHGACPICDTKKKRDEMNCEECGFEFMEKQQGPFTWVLAVGALFCTLSLVAWIKSQQYL